ncbi:hypothetical protein LCI18_011664 [Fusarium solani-melongenae]|uniref:Uncharacterized protein n=1 Tax=Fusarium solani subsp. cucurbitae TaxID=2747967 RepID=A0ACD3ZHF5_FUSSC|nr:hypothetical protein LCI18_011664 [Fusarium solani-melongenae]
MNYNGQPSTFPWYRLPRDLQLNILSFLAYRQGHTNRVESPSEKSTVKPHVGHVGKGAAVCRDWQEYFKKILFRKLTVHQKDLAGLHKISRCRTERIQHLWLRIELLPYDCLRCHNFEALRKLFSILHSWKGRNPSHPNSGLTLELSVHSPSDSQHEFQNFSFEDDDDKEADVCTIDDPHHGWVGGRRNFQPIAWAVAEVFGGVCRTLNIIPAGFHWPAPVVKHLLVRRQTRRRFGYSTLRHLMNCLPGLEAISLEFWRTDFRWEQDARDQDFLTLWRRHLPNHVKRLTFFEDFDEDIDSMFAGPSFVEAEYVRTPNRALGAALAGLRNQKSLHVSFIVDAYDFFDGLRHYRHDRAWRNLTHLSLTSILLRPETPLSQIQRLLMMAASAMRRFPNLEVLELWYGRRGEARLFRFSRTYDGTSKIFRAGTWELPLPPTAMKAWNKLSELRGGKGLTVSDPERIDRELIRSHGDAIHHLGLVSDVLHPVSLRQIRREAQSYGPSWR